LFPVSVLKEKIKYEYWGLYNKFEGGCLLGCCTLEFGRHWLMFQRSLVLATLVETHHFDVGDNNLL
jgi:hypothetical protein